MLRVDTLGPEARKVYGVLRGIPALGGFILIGGTAIALQHGHRVSLDFDFAQAGGRVLDRAAIRSALDALSRSGCAVVPVNDVSAMGEAENDGLDLLDYH